ncbi:MAG: hypothetical protein HON90_17000 [Halobacteriovoraceae bacterium]|jgi:hypothetical protein|nr:hypothetical protein [Halobacteriovoraceae bacterium]
MKLRNKTALAATLMVLSSAASADFFVNLGLGTITLNAKKAQTLVHSNSSIDYSTVRVGDQTPDGSVTKDGDTTVTINYQLEDLPYWEETSYVENEVYNPNDQTSVITSESTAELMQDIRKTTTISREEMLAAVSEDALLAIEGAVGIDCHGGDRSGDICPGIEATYRVGVNSGTVEAIAYGVRVGLKYYPINDTSAFADKFSVNAKIHFENVEDLRDGLESSYAQTTFSVGGSYALYQNIALGLDLKASSNDEDGGNASMALQGNLTMGIEP